MENDPDNREHPETGLSVRAGLDVGYAGTPWTDTDPSVKTGQRFLNDYYHLSHC